MTTSDLIRELCEKQYISLAKLCRRIGQTSQLRSIVSKTLFYKDTCELIHIIANGKWIPNLIVFQYVFSDMQKHTDVININNFISTFAVYYNENVNPNTYIILNDINLGRG